MKIGRVFLIVWVVLSLLLTPGGLAWGVQAAANSMAMGNRSDIVGPTGSGAFGSTVVALPNGNIVVVDPLYDDGSAGDVGAVYLYNGKTRAQISKLTGSAANDLNGCFVTVLKNGNYVIASQNWDKGAALNAGAVTFGSAVTGVSGIISESNSLVGSNGNDRVGIRVTALANDNYVVGSQGWNNNGAGSAGAATWGSGTTGITGIVSASNSLVGSKASDYVGNQILALTNGNFVVVSIYWDNGSVVDAGAVTWGDGTMGITGAISASNSLVGSTANDRVGGQYDNTKALANGNYVVGSWEWDHDGTVDVGAGTWGDGTTGITGVVSESNSLIGSTPGDKVSIIVEPLANGNYAVSSPFWDNGGVQNTGAVTWASGTTGLVGVVSTGNSLVSSTADDTIGAPLVALSDGNYVAASSGWDNGSAVNAGAVTWLSGTTSTSQVISADNSLVGSKADDQIGMSVTPLTNGSYVIQSRFYDNGTAENAGAFTWCRGGASTDGEVSSANSLVGKYTADAIGDKVVALTNGNYVVSCFQCDNGDVADVGAVIWGSGTTGISGEISPENSLMGSISDSYVGATVVPLADGNYVVSSPWWKADSAVVDVGAATWGNGTTGITGVVSKSNSLIGNKFNDRVGYIVQALSDGSYVVYSPYFDDPDVKVVTWSSVSGISGYVTAENSVTDASAWLYDPVNDQLVVGRASKNIVTLVKREYYQLLPIIQKAAAQ